MIFSQPSLLLLASIIFLPILVIESIDAWLSQIVLFRAVFSGIGVRFWAIIIVADLASDFNHVDISTVFGAILDLLGGCQLMGWLGVEAWDDRLVNIFWWNFFLFSLFLLLISLSVWDQKACLRLVTAYSLWEIHVICRPDMWVFLKIDKRRLVRWLYFSGR